MRVYESPVIDYITEKLGSFNEEDCVTAWPFARSGEDLRPSVNVPKERRSVSAVRYAWFLLHGRWNEGWLLHKCHNKDCWNPHHMKDNGTPKENATDCVEAGRNYQLSKDICPKGHPLDGRRKNGNSITRYCKTCNRERQTARRSNDIKPGQNRKANATGYKGINKRRYSWSACINWKGYRHHIGSFKSALEAAHAYDDCAFVLHGRDAYLNFPDRYNLRLTGRSR